VKIESFVDTASCRRVGCSFAYTVVISRYVDATFCWLAAREMDVALHQFFSLDHH
jgi:hypothetical protein